MYDNGAEHFTVEEAEELVEAGELDASAKFTGQYTQDDIVQTADSITKIREARTGRVLSTSTRKIITIDFKKSIAKKTAEKICCCMMIRFF